MGILKLKRMTWIFIVSAATAILALLSGYLQYREKIETTQKNLKKEEELTQVYKKLQEKSDEIISFQKTNQEKTDELVDVQRKLQEKTNEIVKIQNKGLNELTGGNSYPSCHLPITNDGGNLFVQMYNNGNYTIDNLIVKVVDIGDFQGVEATASELLSQFGKFGMNTQNVPSWPSIVEPMILKHLKLAEERSFDIIKPHQTFTLSLSLPKNEFTGYNILCQSNRQDWIILLRVVKFESFGPGLPNRYKAAFKVLRIDKNRYSELYKSPPPYEGFPINNKGEIKWFRDDLKMKW